MYTRKRHLLAVFVFAGLMITCGILSDIYKLAWISDWLGEFLFFFFLVTLFTYGTHFSGPAFSRQGWARRMLIIAAIFLPIWTFLNIDIAPDAQVPMRLFGLSWTMSGESASHLFSFGTCAIALAAAALMWREYLQKAAAAKDAVTDPKSSKPPDSQPAA